MSSRLRSLDSRISFFAFADIITAVSGVLIFVALLLATDLGRPTDNHSQVADSETAQQLQKILAQQADVDTQNQRLQGLLTMADSAPDTDKIQADISKLNAQISEEQKKQKAIAAQIADAQAAISARDKALGLTDLKATLQRLVEEAESMTREDSKTRSEMDSLDQQVAQQQANLLKLRQREGQLWLIPDKSSTTKEPILVTVAGASVTVEHFDHPEQRKQLEPVDVNAAFQSYLREAKAIDQYVVFLVRPSGIGTFQGLVKSARDMGFDVGFDALEEDRQIHFSTPPAIDETAPATGMPDAAPDQHAATADSHVGSPAPASAAPAVAPPESNRSQPVAAPSTPATPKDKSWWQKFVEWIGLG